MFQALPDTPGRRQSHPWEETKSSLAEYHWVRLEPEAKQRPLQPKLHTSKAKSLASTAHLSLLQEEPPLGGLCGIRLAGSQLPSQMRTLVSALSIAQMSSKPLNSCLEVREFVLDKLHQGGREGMTKPVGRKAWREAEVSPGKKGCRLWMRAADHAWGFQPEDNIPIPTSCPTDFWTLLASQSHKPILCNKFIDR